MSTLRSSPLLFCLLSGIPLGSAQAVALQPAAEPQPAGIQPPATQTQPKFVNPIYEGADPWVIKKNGMYYFCQSEGDRAISVWKSPKLTDKGIKRVVWKPQEGAWNSRQIWAPELHYLRGRWYIYYAASDGRNENHRTGVLEAATDDPQGPYIDRGILYTGDDIAGGASNRWSIDATPLELHGQLYLIWSGWPTTEDIQYLYIARMSDPITVSSNRVKIAENDTYLWERVGETLEGRGLHEGQQIIHRHGKVFMVYSCSGSWEPTYKLALLYMDENDDPMDPASWTKLPEPVFQSTDRVWGVGHASFTRSPDDTEDWIVYHSKVSRKPGWQRAVSLQPFRWTEDGFPDFGSPRPHGQPLRAPSGERGNQAGTSFRDSFDDGTWDPWVYYGYNRYIRVEEGALSIGGHPVWGLVNHYRTGEKALVRGYEWSDVSVSVRVHIEAGDRDAGLLFRVRWPALGYDAQRGYFAGIIPGANKVVLGRTDGARWHELALVDHPVVQGRWYRLRVEAQEDLIRVYLDDELQIALRDSEYAEGMVGVRVVDSHALFDDFEVAPISRTAPQHPEHEPEESGLVPVTVP